jgi:hypothetical protein
MRIEKINTEFFYYDLPDAEIHKNNLLKLINLIPKNPFQGISHTDYNLPDVFERKYLKYFYDNILSNMMNEQLKYYNAEKWEVGACWFQQYENESSHFWHTHPGTNFTNIYFLELPDESLKTTLKVGEKDYEYDIKEGQIITFPASIRHTSKINNTNKRKTVISFNSDFF